MALPFKTAFLKGLVVKKAVITGAAALAAVSTVGTVAAVSAGSLAVSAQPEQPQSAVVATENTPDTVAALPNAAPVEDLVAVPESAPTEDTEDAALPAQTTDEAEPEDVVLPKEGGAALPKAAAPAATDTEPGNAAAPASDPAADTGAVSAPQAPAAQSAAATVPEAPAPAAPAPAPAPTPTSSSATHTTSIYDETGLLRKEYYNENNQLYEYSDVHDYNGENNSYTENIYRYDEELGQEILVRIDVYENGVLVSSITP